MRQIENITSVAQRPYIAAQIFDLNTKALYDTGADVSCISEKVFRQIHPDLRPSPTPTNSPRSFRAANGQNLKVRGRYCLPIEIQGHQSRHNFYVISQLSEEVILGMDFIRNNQFTFCPVQNSFYWGPNKQWTKGEMRTTQEATIKGLSTDVLKVNLFSQEGNKVQPTPFVVGCVSVEDTPSLMGGPGLLQVDSVGQSFMEVINTNPVEVVIPRGTLIGFIERYDEDTVTKVNPQLVNALAEEEVKRQKRPFLTEEKRQFILDNLTINVPEQFKVEYTQLVLENHDVFSESKYDLGRATTMMHDIELKTADPIYVKQFKIPEAHMKEVETHVKEWLKLGVIQPSRSKYNSPLFIVAKKDGGVRIVQDFRALNAQSQMDKYSMKDISECIGEIGRSGSTIFSTLDLTSGFWQMVLHPKCRPYTAFTVPGMGQYQWVTSPMGLLGCPASFQRLVEAVMQGIRNVIVYIDDLLIHSQNHQEHLQTLRETFARLRAHGLKANIKKCVFGSTSVSYLGFRLTPEGIKPGIDKLKVISNSQPPANVHEIRQFLGLCNFFRSHVRNFAQISAPLTCLTRKDSAWKSGPLPESGLKAFKELRTLLISEPIVDYPRQNRSYALIVDAALGDDKNVGGLGAILTQINEKQEHCVIAYASRKLSAHEKNYTPFLLEMQACVWGIDHFGNYLRGRHFKLFTDHKPLEKLGKVHTRTLNRLQEIMNQYDFEIIYKKGSEMPADYLSRHAIDSISWESDHIRQEQDRDPFLSALKKFLLNQELPTGPREQALIKFLGTDCFVENDVIWRRLRRPQDQNRVVLMLPRSLIPQVLREAHGKELSGHDGIYKTRERILTCYYWPGIDKDVGEHLRACEKCQFRKPKMAEPNLLTPLPQTTEPNQRIHADLFGPLKTSGTNKKYILVITDAFTKYVELVAIHDKEAITVTTAIFNRWICRYGVPLEIITDQGKEFLNKLSDELWKLLGTQHNTTTARHPQCNAQAEVANKTIAKYLASFVDSSTLDWELYLPPLMFSYNTSYHKSVGNTPFYLTFGMSPRTLAFPGPDIQRKFYGESDAAEIYQRLLFARDLARRHNEGATSEMKTYHDMKANQQNFRVSQWVLLDEHSFLHKNAKLAPKFSGPHQILKLKGNNVVELRLKNGKRLIVNTERLKDYNFPIALEAQGASAPHREPQVEVPPNAQTESPSEMEEIPEEPYRPIIPDNDDTRLMPDENIPIPDPTPRRRGRPPKVRTFVTPSDSLIPEAGSMEQDPSSVTFSEEGIPIVPDRVLTRHQAKTLLSQLPSNQVEAIKKGLRTYHRLRNWSTQQKSNYLKYGDPYIEPSYPEYVIQDTAPSAEGSDSESSSASDNSDDDEEWVPPEPVSMFTEEDLPPDLLDLFNEYLGDASYKTVTTGPDATPQTPSGSQPPTEAQHIHGAPRRPVSRARSLSPQASPNWSKHSVPRGAESPTLPVTRQHRLPTTPLLDEFETILFGARTQPSAPSSKGGGQSARAHSSRAGPRGQSRGVPSARGNPTPIQDSQGTKPVSQPKAKTTTPTQTTGLRGRSGSRRRSARIPAEPGLSTRAIERRTREDQK